METKFPIRRPHNQFERIRAGKFEVCQALPDNWGKEGRQILQKRWEQTIGRIQPLPPGGVHHYLTADTGVFVINEAMDFTGFDHRHQGYEFIVPSGASMPYLVEDRALMTEHNQLFPFNPGQPHRAVDGTTCPGLLAIFFGTGFLRELAGSVADTQEVLFRSLSLPFDAGMRRLVNDFIQEMKLQQPGHDLAVESIAIQMGIRLLRHAAAGLPVYGDAGRISDRKVINEAIDFIHANYARNFSLAELAEAVHLSPFHLSRLFKAETGLPPFEYLTGVKIERAKHLLLAGGRTVTQVCYESGFNNLSHFSRVFSARVGASPSAFRRGAI